MNKEQAKGHINVAKGKAKEAAGKIFGNKELENKGKIQGAYGEIQGAVGDVQEDIKKASDKKPSH